MKKLLIFVIIITFPNQVVAWDNTTNHRHISEIASGISLDPLLLTKFYQFNGVEKTLSRWIQDGSELEDAGSFSSLSTARFRNHFHNPLANLSVAGLSDLMSGESTLLWSQDGTNQGSFVRGDWSWQTVRNHYYRSLTATNKAEIDEFTVRTYLGLGYQMHLVQDMSQPDHVRNDAHPVDGAGIKGIEKWAKKEFELIRQYAASATKPTVDLTQPLVDLVPVGRLMDTRRYAADRTPSSDMNQGLAEYTNANFFSDDSVFAARFATNDKHYFPYPRKEGTDIQTFFSGTKQPETMQSEDGKSVKGLWISKVGEGEAVPHLVRVGPLADFYYSVFGEGTLFYDSLYRDEISYEDYARLLIPRAVGYSASLLDYFFRGEIELSLPARGVYALAAPDGQFSEIRVRAKNTTASGEEMNNGFIQLVIKYRMALSDPFQSEPVEVGPETYIVVPVSNNVTGIPRGTPTELVFDLSINQNNPLAHPLPLWATNVTMQVVYKGQLGAEADAVAVGFRDISEPTPIDIVNNMDHVCINGSYMLAGSTDAINAVDFDHDGKADFDVYPHTLNNFYLAFNGNYASSSNYTATFTSIPPGSYGRVFLLADYSTETAHTLRVSGNTTLASVDPRDNTCDRYVTPWYLLTDAIENDDEYYPEMYVDRGLRNWWAPAYENLGYPSGTACDSSSAQPDLSGSVSVTLN